MPYIIHEPKSNEISTTKSNAGKLSPKLILKSVKVIIYKPLFFLCGTEESRINRTAFWTMFTALFTVPLFFMGYFELRDYRATTNSQFIQELSSDFFTPQCREFIALAEHDLLIFKIDSSSTDSIIHLPFGCEYFLIDKSYKDFNRTLLDTSKNIFMSYEIDDIILNKLDAIGQYEHNGIVKLRDIDIAFDYYYHVALNNNAIQDYLKWLKVRYPNDDYYKRLREIQKKLDDLHGR